ncbi:MAG: AsmA family protein [Deltaproteobacteria bacterium]|nr:AsmA family protein [Deltaproteobacteria bacterium]
MKKRVKLIGIIILSSFLFLIAAAVVLPYLISLDNYKGIAEETLEKALQRDCSIGKLRITILPTIGAKLEDFVISNPPGFSETPLISLQTLKIKIKIIPLLFGKKVISGTLYHPEIFIEKDPRGRSNIPYMEKTSTSDRKGTLKSGKVKTDESKALQGISLTKASIKEGKFIYLDRTMAPARRTEIERIDLDLKDLSLEKKILYKLSLQWSPGAVTLEGWAGPLGKTIDIKNIPLEGQIRADFPKLDGLMQQLTGEKESTMQGALKADLDFKGNTSSALTAQGEILLKNLTVGEKEARTIEDLDIVLRPEIDISGGAERLQLNATLLLDKTPFKINGLFRDLQRKPVGKLTLSSQEGVDLEELGPKFPALHQMAKLKGQLDLTGDLIVPAQGTPLFSLEANSSRIDITLAEQKKATEKEPEPKAQKEEPAAKKQSAKKSSFDAEAKVTVKKGTFQGTDFQNFLLTAEMKGGEVRITRFTCAAFEGTMEGNGTFNMGQEPSPFRMKTKVTGVDANALLSSFTSAKGMLKGKFNGDITLGGAGFSLDTLKKNLTGTGTVQIMNGELSWLNLIGRIVQALGGKGWGKDKTTFEDLTSVFTIKNGRVSIPDLNISQEDVYIKLFGDIGLDATVKMDGEAHLPQSVTGDLSGKGWRFFADDKGRLTIPFSLKGDINDPKVGISTRLIEQGVKGLLDEFLKKKTDK